MTQPQEDAGVRYELFSLPVCDAVATVVAEAFASITDHPSVILLDKSLGG